MPEQRPASGIPASRAPLDPATLADQFRRLIDGLPADFVRPADTTDPVWVVYQESQPLGTVSALRTEEATTWRIQASGERMHALDDTVRALRRPRTWSRDRAQASDWARRTLADPRTVLIDLETTGLTTPYAVQIAAIDAYGRTIIDTLVQPQEPIEDGAIAVHGVTMEMVREAPIYAAILPRLADALTGRHCVAYNSAFDRECLARETARATAAGHPQASALWQSLTWADAMEPYAAWRGLWHAGRGTYRAQPLGGTHRAASDCFTLLERMNAMADGPAWQLGPQGT
ncbi:3'-5' exonuclease [Streptomyces sp. NPDC059193]|uniref:3'-5' exonuclease n=1 Tax=Streptomyces sp. NPDC059193 TaxID=3346763 RepID=UPI0036A0C93D